MKQTLHKDNYVDIRTTKSNTRQGKFVLSGLVGREKEKENVTDSYFTGHLFP